ncbi:MAG: MFS transporter [Fimbriimonas ginsengisoli]|uniref:MFS transporter n=1 Tax=Fimbriimonas ginsengisoli TaxID=1005039 RepID=A0A931LTA0_FIMGI|nr:MFS transporter [Fimbriimonas ginsengisoli]
MRVEGPSEAANPSTENERRIRPVEHLLMSGYWFGSNFMWGALLPIVLPHEMEAMAHDRKAQMLGVLAAFGALPALLVPLIAGAMSDRCTSRFGRRRPFIFWGALVGCAGIVGLMLAGQAANLPFYFAAYFVVQFGANTALAAYSGVIPDLVPHSQRGVASGYMALMSQLSTLLGALLMGRLIKNDPALVYMIMLAVFAAFSLLTLWGVKESPLREEPPELDWIEYLKSLWISPKDYPDFAWVWITRFLMMMGFYSILFYLNYYLRDVVHVLNPNVQAGQLIGLSLLAATISGYLGGAISDRIGRKPVVYASSFVIALVCLALVFCHSLNQALFAGVVFGLGYGAYISVDWALGTDTLPSKEHAGKDMGVWHVAMTLPQQMAPLFAGLILQQFLVPGRQGAESSYAWVGYALIFGFAALFFALGGYLLKNVRGVS